MANARKAIRDRFCALLLAEVDDLAAALPYEPGAEALPAMPCVTMLADMFGQVDRETGPVTDNTHGWELRLYVALAEADDMSAYEAAQEQIEDLVPAVYTVVRKYPDIDGTCEWARIGDAGQPVEFLRDGSGRYALKRMQLRAELFETVP